MGDIDISKRQQIGLVSTPALPGQYTIGAITIPANSNGYFVVNTTPSNTTLQLWNFLFSISIDPPTITNVLDTDSNGVFKYILPIGTSLTAGQLAVTIDPWTDWSLSQDAVNRRTNIIRVHNQDGSPHTYWLLFKSYTFSNAAAGASGGQGGGGI